MKKTGFLLWLFTIVVSIVIYLLILRNMIELSYHDTAPDWFNRLVNAFYPRFIIEKHRFGMSFFLQRADQVILRLCSIQLLLLAGLYSFIRFPRFKKAFIEFWQPQTTVRNVKILSILFYAGMIFFTYEWYGYLTDLSKASVFYKPLLMLRILHVSFPAPPILVGLYISLLTCCTAIILQFKPVLCSIVVTSLFILLQGFLYSFEKLDHTFATFTYASLLMPFLLIENRKAIRQHNSFQAAWPLRLICVCISLSYLMSGLEKLLISGFTWIHPENFRSYIFLHQAPLGLQVSQYDFLCSILPALALLFQLGFIAILIFPRYKFVFLFSGLIFHAGTYLLLNVGWYVNAWIFVYIFFIDWPPVYMFNLWKSLFMSAFRHR